MWSCPSRIYRTRANQRSYNRVPVTPIRPTIVTGRETNKTQGQDSAQARTNTQHLVRATTRNTPTPPGLTRPPYTTHAKRRREKKVPRRTQCSDTVTGTYPVGNTTMRPRKSTRATQCHQRPTDTSTESAHTDDHIANTGKGIYVTSGATAKAPPCGGCNPAQHKSQGPKRPANST